MTGQNQFYPVAIGDGANVLTPAQWASSNVRQTGFQAGIAPSNAFNTAWRQSSFMMAMLGQFIADTNHDALDNGDLAALEAAYRAALVAYLQGALTFPTPPGGAQLWHIGTAAGTPQSLTVNNLTAPIADYSATEVPCLIRIPFTIGSGATINFSGIGPLPILRADGSAVKTGDVPAPILFGTIHVDGFRLIGLGRAEVQQIVTNVTLFVRSDGSDANDGSANDAGHAFLTIAAALASAIRFSNTSTVVIQLGTPGTYAAPGAFPKTGASFQVLGDSGNPQNFNINGAGTASIPPILVAGASLLLNGVQVNNTGTINNTLGANLGGSIEIRNSILTSVNGNVNYHAAAFAAGGIVIGDGTRFAGPMGGMVSANGGTVVIGGAASVVNAPNWSTGGVAAVGSGNVSLVAGGSLTGAATGPRYYLTTNGVINTNGAGVNYFPGDVAGVQQSGGQYV